MISLNSYLLINIMAITFIYQSEFYSLMITIWIYTILSVIVISLISLIGVVSFAFREDRMRKMLLFFVSFAAGALLGDTFIHLLPEAVHEYGFTLEISLFILGGMLIFFVLEKFIHWRHCHVPISSHHQHPLGIMNLVGDGFHNFIDGMIVASSYIISIPLGLATTLAVILHEIPQEIGDFGILLHAGFSRGKALFFNFISASIAILGAVVVLAIGSYTHNLSYFLVPFTAGGFIYIASSDLIPELHKESEISISFFQFFSLLLGIGIMALLLLLR
jgi:zinc and cadmium transporter